MTRRLEPGNPWCRYCKRPLLLARLNASNSMTFDHVIPQARGGWKRVPCCRKCNMLKSDLDHDDWFWFIQTFPRWWKTFDTPEQVLAMVRQGRRMEAYARAGRELPK